MIPAGAQLPAASETLRSIGVRENLGAGDVVIDAVD